MIYRGSEYDVKIVDDSVAIYDPSEKELLYWDRMEWVEDPSVAVMIANAVAMALTRPEEFKLYLRKLQPTCPACNNPL